MEVDEAKADEWARASGETGPFKRNCCDFTARCSHRAAATSRGISR